MKRHIASIIIILVLPFFLYVATLPGASLQSLGGSSSSGSGTVNVANSGGSTSSASTLNFNQPLFQTTTSTTSTVDYYDANPSGQQQLAIPMYIDPNVTPAAWTTVTALAPRGGLLVANVLSGPGPSQNATYLAAINAAKASGQLVLGYVDTNGGAIATATVTGQVDSWYTFYGVDGIFFDRAATSPATIPYYQNLYAYVRTKTVNHIVCLNPGTDTDEGYAAISDIIMDFENTYAAYTVYSPPAWTRKYSPRKFWHCVHTTVAGNMAAGIALGKKNRAYWVNFTDDILANPYDTLASYIASEAQTIGYADGVDTRLVTPGVNGTVLQSNGTVGTYATPTGTGAPVLAGSPTFTGTVNTAGLTVAAASALTATNSSFLKADRGSGFTCTGTAASTIVCTMDSVTVSDGTNGTVLTTVNGTVNSGTAGPNLNGRDQNAAFASGVWVYLYGIGGNGLTSGYVLSTSATAPTLTGALAGYKSSKPLTAYFSTGAGAILTSFVHYGSWTYVGAGNVVSAGGNTTFGVGVSATSFVPPSAGLIMISGVLTSSTTVAHNASLSYDGTSTLTVFLTSQVLTIPVRSSGLIMPIISQTVYYAVTGAGDVYNESILAWAFPSGN